MCRSHLGDLINRRRTLSFLPLLFLIALTAACTDSDLLLFHDLELSEILLEPQEAVLAQEGETQFNAILIDMEGREIAAGPDMPQVTWTSASTSIAQVDPTGRVFATGNGFTTVMATVAGHMAEGTVIVQPELRGTGFERPELQFEGIAGLPLDEDAAVRVETVAGDGVQGVTVRFAPRPGSGSVSRQLAVTDRDGIARTSWTLGRRAGLHRVDLSIPTPDEQEAAVLADNPQVAASPPERNPHGKLIGNARPGKPKEIVVSPSSAARDVGDSLQFQAEVRDQHGNVLADADVLWASLETQVATIDEEAGVADPVADGVAVMEASIDGVTGSATLTVGNGDGTVSGPVGTLSIHPSNWTLAGIGDTVRLDAVARDDEGRTVPDASVDWASQDPEVASVTSEGLVTAKAIGPAIIAATLICTASGCEEITASSEGAVEEADEMTAPERVTDLRVVESSSSSLILEFTEVDDGTGAPAAYAFRYGTPTISWGPAASTEVTLEGSDVGNTRRHEYPDLNPETEYEFQMVAYRGMLGADATFGELSNKASGATQVVEPGDPAWMAVTPSSATIYGIGSTVQLSADVRDEDGNLVPEASVEWSSSDPAAAIVSQEGIVEAKSVGTALIVASVMCGSVACEDSSHITVQQHTPSERYPNEPAGFEPWFVHDWATFPNEWGGQRMFASEKGLIVMGADHLDNFEIVEDPEGPHGYGRYLRHTQMEGQAAGHSSGRFDLLSPKPGAGESRSYEDQIHLRSVYRSHWVYFEPDPVTNDWQFGNVHMRTFWWNRMYGLSHGNVALRSPDDAHPPKRYDFFRGATYWHSEPSTIYSSDVVVLPIGEWHQFEYLWERLGDFGDEGDSRVRIWINGTQVEDNTITHLMPAPMGNDRFDMIWRGGSGNTRSQDDFVRFAGIYVSGLRHED